MNGMWYMLIQTCLCSEFFEAEIMRLCVRAFAQAYLDVLFL